MSELLAESNKRKGVLKHLILQLHDGMAPPVVRDHLVRLLGQVPYEEVVQVEQELIEEGLPMEEVLKLCDVHTAALRSVINLQRPQKSVAPGHPIHTFRQENEAIQEQLSRLNSLFAQVQGPGQEGPAALLDELRHCFTALLDVDKHYNRKENLLFPFLEKHGITGPSRVMWGKDDEVRALLKGANQVLCEVENADTEDLKAIVDLVLKPACAAVDEMIYKEEQILLPMSLDTLSDEEWHQIYNQTIQFGHCLYEPTNLWEAAEKAKGTEQQGHNIQLPTGGLSVTELTALLNTLPFEVTFVDKEDRVRFFTQGKEKIFARGKAVLGRKVQLCHPPKSVHMVQQILDDFRAGRADSAPFWINFKGRFVHIEYFAVRDPEGGYLGTLEVTQDLTEKKNLEGEQRLVQYRADAKDRKDGNENDASTYNHFRAASR